MSTELTTKAALATAISFLGTVDALEVDTGKRVTEILDAGERIGTPNFQVTVGDIVALVLLTTQGDLSNLIQSVLIMESEEAPERFKSVADPTNQLVEGSAEDQAIH